MGADSYVEEMLEEVGKRTVGVRYSFFPGQNYVLQPQDNGTVYLPPLLQQEPQLEFDRAVAADRTFYANGKDLRFLDWSLPRSWGFTDRESVVGINPNHPSRAEREDTWMHEIRWHVWMGNGDEYDTGFWVQKERERGRGYT